MRSKIAEEEDNKMAELRWQKDVEGTLSLWVTELPSTLPQIHFKAY